MCRNCGYVTCRSLRLPVKTFDDVKNNLATIENLTDKVVNLEATVIQQNQRLYALADEVQLNTIPKAGVTDERPEYPNLGEVYFDTTLGKPIWYNGVDWVDAGGVVV